MTDPRYPIGRFAADANPTPETRARHIEAIAGLPPRMRQAVASLTSWILPIETAAGASERWCITFLTAT